MGRKRAVEGDWERKMADILMVGSEECGVLAQTNGDGIHFIFREVFKDEGLGNTKVLNKPLFEVSWEQLRLLRMYDPIERRHL